MKMAYLINAHKDFGQLERLVAKLHDDGVDFFIHIDKKADDAEVKALFEQLYNYNVTQIKERVDVIWGGFAQLQAMINGMRAILRSGNQYDYINFISGQDYPIKSNKFIRDFLTNNKGYEFIECEAFTSEEWVARMPRFQQYWFIDSIKNNLLRGTLQRILTALLPKRKVPMNFIAYGGAAWWSISLDCMKYILNFIDNNKEFVDFYKYTTLVDEMFFQTIVMNSEYRTKVKDYLHYVDWSKGGHTPKILTREDFESLKSSKKLFARKFDCNVDAEILNMLDIN